MKATEWGPESAQHLISDLAVWVGKQREVTEQQKKDQRQLEELRQSVAEMTRLDRLTKAATGAFTIVALFWGALILLTMVCPPTTRAWANAVAFVLFVAGGACGASWSAYREPSRHAVPRALLAGGLGGLIVALLYLLPQWVPASAADNMNAQGLVSAVQLQLVLGSVTAFAVGVGGDHALERVRQRGDAEMGEA
jgi:hypothetical protein